MKNGKPKTAKRQRSKRQKREFDKSRKVLMAVLSVLGMAFLVLLIACLTGTLRVSVIPVGTSIHEGVYEVYMGDSKDVATNWASVGDKSGFANQFYFSYDSAGVYTIRNVYTNMILSAAIADESDELSFELSLPSDNCAQKWLVSDAGDNGYRLVSTCDLRLSGVWNVEVVNLERTLPDPAEQIIASGIYAFIPNANAQGMVSVLGQLNLQVIDKSNSLGQLFEINYNERGFYNIYHLESGTFLDITDDGNLILSADRRLYCGQDWSITQVIDAYQVASSCTGYAVGARDGTNVGTVAAERDDTVQWQIEERVTVLFVGDSITYGETNCNYGSGYCGQVASNAVDTEMSILNSTGVGKYIEVNMGKLGSTANGYLYRMDSRYSQMVLQYRVSIAQIMLGANDAASYVSSGQYARSISGIIDGLKGAGVKTVILNRPIWKMGNERLLNDYFNELTAIADGETVFSGDTEGFDWFKQNSWHLDNGGRGFHPDQTGYSVLGELWAAAFKIIVEN